MAIPSAQQRLKAQYPIHFIRTQDDEGEKCFFVLQASLANYQKLMVTKKRRTVDIADYGEVLASGFGTPSDSLRKEMKEKYDIDLPDA